MPSALWPPLHSHGFLVPGELAALPIEAGSWAHLCRLPHLVMGSSQDCCVQVKLWGPEEVSWVVRSWVLLQTI